MQTKQVQTFASTTTIIESLGWKDYYDSYSASFVSDKNIALEHTVIAFFLSMPRPVKWMLGFREKIAKPLGLKTAGGGKAVQKEIEQFTGAIGEKIALMEVWDRSKNEILTGQRDKHLNFALSFLLTRNEQHYELQLITAVKLNNTLGKLYFFLVKPVHKLIMPVIVNNMIRHLEERAPATLRK